MGAGEAALRGEMSAVRSAARRLSDLGGMQQAMHRLRAGIAQVQASGDSVALSRLRAACRPAEWQAQQIAQVRQQAGRALASYAGRVDELQQRARRLRVRRGEAEARRVSLMNTLAAHSSTGAGMDALQAKMRSNLIGEETELGGDRTTTRGAGRGTSGGGCAVRVGAERVRVRAGRTARRE